MNAPRLPTVGDILTAAPRFNTDEMLIDDVTQVCQRVPFIELCPSSRFTPGLVSELADAADRLTAKVAKLQEAQGASR